MLLFITALTASDAPLKPKNIAISLSARWPATPLAAEAAEFIADEGLFYKFVEGMAKTTPATTDHTGHCHRPLPTLSRQALLRD